jgi:hypothetical protein
MAGLAPGEWRNSPPKAMRQMATGVLLLVAAICSLSALNLWFPYKFKHARKQSFDGP